MRTYFNPKQRPKADRPATGGPGRNYEGNLKTPCQHSGLVKSTGQLSKL